MARGQKSDRQAAQPAQPAHASPPAKPVDLDGLLQILRGHGLRVTPQRREILRLLLESNRHLTAQECFEKLRPSFPDLSLDTVYRTLRTLTVLGIACQSHLQTPHVSRFGLAAGEHHHHLVCIDCGDTFDLDVCPVSPGIQETAARLGFQVAGHALEIYGYCKACHKEAH